MKNNLTKNEEKALFKFSIFHYLAMFCFALVAWTIVETGYQEGDPKKSSNVTVIKIDDNISIDNMNFTVISKGKLEKENKTLNETKEKIKNITESVQTRVRLIKSPIVNGTSLCNLICNKNVTVDEVIEALEHMRDENLWEK